MVSPRQSWLVEIVLQTPRSRHNNKPPCVTAHNAPRLSLLTDGKDSYGRPLALFSRAMARDWIWFNPPPPVPTHILPSRSSSKLRISRCDVGTFSKSDPS